MNSLNKNIWDELYLMSERLKNSRGDEEISQCILDGVEKLSGNEFFDLPERFSNVFSKFQKHEGILYNLPYYRDHFLHMFHVFYLGYLILNGWWNKKVSFFENLDENTVLKIWFIASIQHDIAYPVEKTESWVPSFPKEALDLDVEIRSMFDWSPIILVGENGLYIEKITERFITPLKNNLNNEEIFLKQVAFRNWLNEQILEKHDHGVLSSLSILNFGWREEDLEYVYDAALSVALHNYWKNPDITQGELAFSSYPLAFLLTYCDTAQEWGRAQAEPHNKNLRLVDTSVKFSKLEVNSAETIVVLSYEIEEWCRKNIKDWSILNGTQKRVEIGKHKNKICTILHSHVQPLRQAWGRGTADYSFAIHTRNVEGETFCTTRVI